MDKKKHLNQFSKDNPLISHSARMAWAKKLIDEGATYKVIQETTGISQPTISKIKKGKAEVNEVLYNAVRDHEVKKMTFLASGILDSIDDDNIKKASLQQKVTSSAILMEKRAAIEGKVQPQVNIVNIMGQMANELQELKAMKEVLEAE